MTAASGDAVVLAPSAAGHLTGEDLVRLAQQADKPPAPDHAACTPSVEASCPGTSLRTYNTTARRGAYRVIYAIHDNGVHVPVVRISHRAGSKGDSLAGHAADTGSATHGRR